MTEQQLKQKRRQLMTILNRMNIDEETRHELVYSWTKGRTSSTRELTPDELINLVWKLNNDATMRNAKAAVELQKKQKRSTVLAIAQRCGIHEGTSFVQFNSFMLNKSIHKKEMFKFTINELDELIKQFRAIERNYSRSAQNAGTKAYNHAHGFANVSNN
jgi:hypothetical protein